LNPETKIQNAIVDELNKRHILHWRISGSNNMAGFPDLLVCYRGRFVALEVKTPTGSPTEQQSRVITSILIAGGWAKVVRGWEDVEHLFDEIDNGSLVRMPSGH
jgi:hypothetical protein